MKNLFSLRLTAVIVCIALSLMLAGIGSSQDASLVLYIPFDEETKDEVKDFSQYGNNGQLSGDPKWDKGKFGKALTFDAVDDQVVVPTSKTLDIEEAITMMAWANPGDGLTNDWRTIVGKSPTNVLGQTTFSYDIRTDNNGKLRFSLNIGGWKHVLGPILEIDHWYHIAGTYDGKKMVLYLDGQPIGETPANGKILVTKDPVGIGNIVDAAGASKNEFWTGLIDEVRIWNRGLSAEEVEKNMGFGKDDILDVAYPQGKLAMTWGTIKAR